MVAVPSVDKDDKQALGTFLGYVLVGFMVIVLLGCAAGLAVRVFVFVAYFGT